MPLTALGTVILWARRPTQPNGGFSGSLSGLPLPDLMQMLQALHKSGTLAVHHSSQRSTLVFRDGLIVGCQPPRPSGSALREQVEATLLYALHHPEGDFTFEPQKASGEPGVEEGISPSAALLDAVRVLDEHGRRRPVDASDEDETPTRDGLSLGDWFVQHRAVIALVAVVLSVLCTVAFLDRQTAGAASTSAAPVTTTPASPAAVPRPNKTTAGRSAAGVGKATQAAPRNPALVEALRRAKIAAENPPASDAQ